MTRFLWAALALLCNTACSREISFPPPPQRRAVSRPVTAILDMTTGRPEDLWASVVSGVLPGDATLDWRWTTSHPVFRFDLNNAGVTKLDVRLTAAQTVLEKVGSQKVGFFVNDENVGAAVLTHSGIYDFSYPVDTAVLRATSPIVVRFDVEPCLSGENGAEFGVVLHSVGFIQDPQ